MRVRGDAEAMSVAYDGAEMQYAGQGGSIQLCDTLASLYPRAELLLIGLSEPEARIHAVNESASPEELERIEAERQAWHAEYARQTALLNQEPWTDEELVARSIGEAR